MQTLRLLPSPDLDTLSNRSEETTNMLEARTSLNKNFASGLAINGGLAYRRITVDYDLTNERHLRTLPYAEGQMPAIYAEVQGPIGKRLQYGVGLRVQESRIAYRPDAAADLIVHDDWDAYSSFNLLWMINEARKISATRRRHPLQRPHDSPRVHRRAQLHDRQPRPRPLQVAHPHGCPRPLRPSLLQHDLHLQRDPDLLRHADGSRPSGRDLHEADERQIRASARPQRRGTLRSPAVVEAEGHGDVHAFRI